MMDEKEMNKRAAELMGWEQVFNLWRGSKIKTETGERLVYADEFSPATDRNHAGLLLAEIERLWEWSLFYHFLFGDLTKEERYISVLRDGSDYMRMGLMATPAQITAAFIATLEATNKEE